MPQKVFGVIGRFYTTSLREASLIFLSDRCRPRSCRPNFRNPESDDVGQALGIVQYRGGKEEFDIAVQLARSNFAQERRVATGILAQLGWQDRTYLDESMELLLRLVACNN